MGAMCTKKTVDDVVPNISAGGLAGHTTVSSVRKSEPGEEEEQAGKPLSRAQSKKIVEKQKVQAQLDAVQKQRESQQQRGVQRMHERSQSMKMEKKALSAGRADKAAAANERLASVEGDGKLAQVAQEGPFLFSVGP
mmetsp:Transcript_29938/g.58515  ORF Transcript_29938/g.58515 Transcript_29938/m.58515 type:complete len:137 (-) Transcript_29938:72-482(-)|eukprot:CAMPEP_0173384086 /NCGR_PEP_ID=MMETSP1356-20130122/6653_1 /TAXON_ID=77927 ORGANISM="Hemiselmis virescens, Strain PCC157" /NCGR_SAMPLE_ID=MMETSP1356 /ASSEMBLY_ACC=CAM_ASM_000847 /LENGTH=136 /DNA_ID=CAMNT_0014339263 /DNA_START=192 /DNA_END=602 /DNA_ORIENTATION=-